jgi:glycosyltransferase involved in cell wall biosynthesis
MPAALALILPCYNPPANWAPNAVRSLQRLQQVLPAGTAVHVYLVNDGAARGVSEADLELLRQELPHFTYLPYPTNRGKGFALRTGVQAATEELCLFTDIDFPYEEASMAAIVAALQAQRCDLAVGVRDAAYYAQVPAGRRRVSQLLRRLTRNLLRLPIDDTQCGLKGFNAAGRALFLQTTTDRYLFDLELLLLASRQPAVRTEPVPVALKPGVVLSPLNARVLLTESRNLLRLLLR